MAFPYVALGIVSLEAAIRRLEIVTGLQAMDVKRIFNRILRIVVLVEDFVLV
jgi:hypothetical protein